MIIQNIVIILGLNLRGLQTEGAINQCDHQVCARIIARNKTNTDKLYPTIK